MIMDDNDTTLEVVDDDGAAWRECGPDGCTTSRSRMPRGEDYNDTRAAREALVTVADANSAAVDTLQTLAEAGRRATSALASFAAVIGLAATSLRWTLPIRWESKRRKRRARGRRIEARREEESLWRSLTNPSLGQPWEASDDV
jgi:hypothetical protein